MLSGRANPVGMGYSVMAPSVVIRPMLLPMYSVNHSLPSGPEAMPQGALSGVGMGYSVMAPSVVIRPILPLDSVNHRLPSGPEAMADGQQPVGYSVIVPSVLIRPILLPMRSVNQRLPSGPDTMPMGTLPAVGMEYSVMRFVASAGTPVIPMRTPTDTRMRTTRPSLMACSPAL